MNVTMLSGSISSIIKYKFNSKDDELQNNPSYLYFDFMIDQDNTKVIAVLSGVNKLNSFKKDGIKIGDEIFVEGKLDFRNEIKSQKVVFDNTFINMQIKVMHPVILITNYKLIVQPTGEIVRLADEV